MGDATLTLWKQIRKIYSKASLMWDMTSNNNISQYLKSINLSHSLINASFRTMSFLRDRQKICVFFSYVKRIGLICRILILYHSNDLIVFM